MPKKDFTQIALGVVRQATREETDGTAPKPKQAAKRVGGLKGGPSRAAKLTAEQRSEIARVAAQARWKKS